MIRFTGDADDGDNLATVTGVDVNNHLVYINPHNSASYNYHDSGTWLRCFTDHGNGQVYDNEYPRVNLEPSTWTIGVDGFNAIFSNIVGPNDLTGILAPQPVNLSVDPAEWDSFGYGLKDVTYSYDGLDFTGGFSGAFDVDLALDFFGHGVTVGPLHVDDASMANGLLDQILRINTYKREAFRFYFRKFTAWVNPPGPVGPKKITVYYKDITRSAGPPSADATGTARGVASPGDESGSTIVLVPEAKRTDSRTPRAADPQTRSADLVSTPNLPVTVQEAAITNNYQGGISNITVPPRRRPGPDRHLR